MAAEDERKKLAETFNAIIEMKHSSHESPLSYEKLPGDIRDFVAGPDGDMHRHCSVGRMYPEYIASSKKDLFDKAMVYLSPMFRSS